MIKQLEVYNNNSRGVFRGIYKEYFPRWRGWGLIERGELLGIDEAVEEFYLTQYFYQMKLDLFEDKTIAFLLLNFATLNGKKKALQKLLQVAPSIEVFNTMGVLAKYRLILELGEFYSFTKNTNTDYLYAAYRSINTY